MSEIFITSSVLICVTILIRFVFKGKISRCMQYAMWSIVAIRLLVPIPALSSPISIMNVLPDGRLDTGRVIWSEGNGDADVVEASNYDLSMIDGVNWRKIDHQQRSSSYQVADSETKMPDGREITLRDVIVIIWLSGCVVFLAVFVASNVIFALRLRKRAEYTGIKADGVPVYVVSGIVSPCLFGVIRPKIYITPECSNTQQRFRHVLIHEATHYRHLDHLWALVRGVCLAIYWFDPFVWVAAALSRRDCELACDESVVRKLGEKERIAYGKTLVDMMAIRREPRDLLCTATTMTSGKRGAIERIKLIAKRQKNILWAVIATVIISSVVVGCTFTGKNTAEPDEFADLRELSSQDILRAEAQRLIEGENDNYQVSNTLNDSQIGEFIGILKGFPKESFVSSELLGDTYTALQIETEQEYYMFLVCDDSPEIISVTQFQLGGESDVYNIGEVCVTAPEAADMIRSFASAENPDVLMAAVQSAVVDYMSTGWWVSTEQIDRGDLEAAAFSSFYQEETADGIELYGIAMYRSYDIPQTGDNSEFNVLEDFGVACVITIDSNTLEYTDFWVPGDGAYHDMDIMEKFPEEIAEDFIMSDHSGVYEDLRGQCDDYCKEFINSNR